MRNSITRTAPAVDCTAPHLSQRRVSAYQGSTDAIFRSSFQATVPAPPGGRAFRPAGSPAPRQTVQQPRRKGFLHPCLPRNWSMIADLAATDSKNDATLILVERRATVNAVC